jgi:nucleotide-binding universal stress UspA family protein
MNASCTALQPTFRRILLASDFSCRSLVAARYASVFAKLEGARLWIAHAVAPTVSPDGIPVPVVELAEQAMSQFIESESLRDLPLQTTVDTGDVWDVLSHAIEQHGIDLLVIGTHGRSGLGRIMRGSTAEVIWRNAPCPVLTLGPRVRQDGAADSMLRIVFATDTSRIPQRALACVTRLANENNAQVLFVHVVHSAPGAPVDYPDEVELDDDAYREALCRLKKVVPDSSPFRREPELLIESGVPPEQIVHVAHGAGADLIVMPVNHGNSFARNHAPWTTLPGVVARAPCPVLTVAG